MHVLFCRALWAVLRRLPLARLGAGVALGTALAAVQLLPFLEWLPLSAEYQRRLPASLVAFDPRCWRELLALPLALFPNLYGNPTWPGPYRSYLPWGNYNENVLYVGTLPLLCAVIAVRFHREPPVRALALLVVVAAGMAFHVPVLEWLNAFPGLARANPARLRLVMSFGLALLAGFGVDAVLDGGPAARRWFVGLALAVVAAGLLVAVAGNLLLPALMPRLAAWGHRVVEAKYAALPAPVHPLEYYHAEFDAVLAGVRAAFRVTNLAMYGPVLVALAGLVLARRRAALVALVAGEMVTLGFGYTPAVPRRDFYPTTPVVSRLASDRTLFRMTALGQDLLPDAHMMYGLADVRGLDFPTRWYAAYLDAAGRLPWISYGSVVGTADSPLLRVLNLKYVVDGTGVAELQLPTPRSFVVHEAVTAESDAQALELLRSAPAEVYSRVVISDARDAPVIVGRREAGVAPVSYTPRETVWDVGGTGGYLVNTDAYYPGWKAYVDGAPAQLLRANLAFRAVLVPRGRHTVTFRYEPGSVSVGMGISAVAAFVIAGLLFSRWR